MTLLRLNFARLVPLGLCIALAACSNEQPGAPSAEAASSAAPAAARIGAFANFIPADHAGKSAFGARYATAWDLYQALLEQAGGGAPLNRADMPDWSGLWTREGAPFFDPAQSFSELTTAKLTPSALAELRDRRERSAQGIEYDPISDCSPPGFPRWLAIPFLREFIVTPQQVWLTSETVNNVRRIYTDGRGHPPTEDAYPLWYGDSIGFWSGHTLTIHTSQIRENVFHRNDPRHSDQIEVVEIWNKVNDDTILVDVWSYDPVTLEEPWYTQQTYRKISNPDYAIRIPYWHCAENENNTVIQTDDGSSQFSEFSFGDN